MNVRSLVLLLSFVLVTPVAAQPADPGEAAYQEGRKAYDLREWDKAIERFKEAYRLRSDAASLFNIAQSYRLKGDCVEAIGFYKTYKRNFASAPNIAAVDKFIAELEPCAKERGSKQPEPTTTTTTTTQPEGTQVTQDQERMPPPVEDPGKGKRVAGIVMAGAGVALVGTGFLFGKLARDKAGEVTRQGSVANPPEFEGDLKSADDSGRRFDLFAKISWGVGGAAVIGGVVLYVLGKKGASEASVSVAPANGGGVLVWAGAF